MSWWRCLGTIIYGVTVVSVAIAGYPVAALGVAVAVPLGVKRLHTETIFIMPQAPPVREAEVLEVVQQEHTGRLESLNNLNANITQMQDRTAEAVGQRHREFHDVAVQAVAGGLNAPLVHGNDEEDHRLPPGAQM